MLRKIKSQKLESMYASSLTELNEGFSGEYDEKYYSDSLNIISWLIDPVKIDSDGVFYRNDGFYNYDIFLHYSFINKTITTNNYYKKT